MRRRVAGIVGRHQKAALVIALSVHLVVSLKIALAEVPGGYDFNRFWRIASTPGRPYIDYTVERAPGEVAVLKSVSAIVSDRRWFGVVLLLLNVAADAAIVASLGAVWGVAAAIYYAAVTIPILNLIYQRIDLWSVVAATFAVAAWRRERRFAAGASLVVGTAFKLWPMTLAPLLWNVTGRHRVNARVAVAAAVAGLGLAWFALAGSGGVLQVLTFRGAGGWQIESVVGNLLELVGNPTRDEAGAYRTGWTTGWISLAMFAAAAPLSLWSTWRGARTGRVGTAWIAAVGALLVFSALLSAQFIVWLIPAAAIAWVDGDKRSAWLVAAIVLLTETLWLAYGPVIDGVTIAVLVVTARNVLLATVVALAMRRLAGGDTVPRAATDGRDRLTESLRVDPPRRILIIVRSFVGDAVMTTGAVRSVIARFPDAHITLETTRRAMGVFDNFPGIHARRARSDRFEKLTSVAWLWTTARFDLAILDNSRRRAKVARWGGIRRVVGVREKDDETWLTASVRWQESGHDLFDPLRGVLGLLGADPDVRPCLYPGDDARAAATQALASLPSRPAVGLFVDAGREIKCWPIERFVELGERLERAGFGVVAISGVGGHTLVEPVKARGLRTVEALPHPLVLAEFIRGLAVLVTNDSGPAHLADAVGTPATILYGPTTPVRFAPHGSQHRLLHAGLGCDFYLGRCEGEAATGTCDRRCMRAITVDQVFEAATALART